MKDNFGRAVGTCIVGLGLLAFVISAPTADTHRAYGADSGVELPQGSTVATLGSAAAPAGGQPGGQRTAESVVAQWPERPQRAARKLIDKYGQPGEITDSQLTWFDNGPWRKTVVLRDEVEHNFPSRHFDFLQQWISYRVPVEKFGELARLDGSILVDRTAGLVSSRCDSEEKNFLALNLANDVVRGNKGVDEARQFFGKTVMMTFSGKSTPYTEGLLFKIDRLNSADPDRPVVKTGAAGGPSGQGTQQGPGSPAGGDVPSGEVPNQRQIPSRR